MVKIFEIIYLKYTRSYYIPRSYTQRDDENPNLEKVHSKKEQNQINAKGESLILCLDLFNAMLRQCDRFNSKSARQTLATSLHNFKIQETTSQKEDHRQRREEQETGTLLHRLKSRR